MDISKLYPSSLAQYIIVNIYVIVITLSIYLWFAHACYQFHCGYNSGIQAFIHDLRTYIKMFPENNSWWRFIELDVCKYLTSGDDIPKCWLLIYFTFQHLTSLIAKVNMFAEEIFYENRILNANLFMKRKSIQWLSVISLILTNCYAKKNNK